MAFDAPGALGDVSDSDGDQFLCGPIESAVCEDSFAKVPEGIVCSGSQGMAFLSVATSGPGHGDVVHDTGTIRSMGVVRLDKYQTCSIPATPASPSRSMPSQPAELNCLAGWPICSAVSLADSSLDRGGVDGRLVEQYVQSGCLLERLGHGQPWSRLSGLGFPPSHPQQVTYTSALYCVPVGDCGTRYTDELPRRQLGRSGRTRLRPSRLTTAGARTVPPSTTVTNTSTMTPNRSMRRCPAALTRDDLTAREYLESDPLDLDHLSGRGG